MKEFSHILPVLKAILMSAMSGSPLKQKFQYIAPSLVAVFGALLMMVTRGVMWFLCALAFAKYIELGNTEKVAWEVLFKAVGVDIVVYLISDMLIRKSADRLKMVHLMEMMKGDE